MWHKDRRDTPAPGPQTSGVTPEPATSYQEPAPATPARSGGAAVIGRSISIKGEVTGDEDLIIQGRVEGSVTLKQHAVTVGPEGEVNANIVARVVTVEGKVVGNLSGDEQVVLRASARVEGDIVAPRVSLEGGTMFRGSVEMGEAAERTQRAAKAASAPGKPPETAQKPTEAEKRPGAPGTEGQAGKPKPDGLAEVRR